MIGLIQSAEGFGLLIGPAIGAGLYWFDGYHFLFMSIGGLFLIVSFFIDCMFHEKVDEMISDPIDGIAGVPAINLEHIDNPQEKPLEEMIPDAHNTEE